jgi:hypothetical protein
MDSDLIGLVMEQLLLPFQIVLLPLPQYFELEGLWNLFGFEDKCVV